MTTVREPVHRDLQRPERTARHVQDEPPHPARQASRIAVGELSHEEGPSRFVNACGLPGAGMHAGRLCSLGILVHSDPPGADELMVLG